MNDSYILFFFVCSGCLVIMAVLMFVHELKRLAIKCMKVLYRSFVPKTN